MFKKLLLALVLLVILVLAGGILTLDKATRAAVEHGGEYALGVETTLDDASVGLFSGNVDLSGLTIDNPAGFEGDFLTMGEAGLGVGLGSLLGDEVQVRRFELRDLTLTLSRTDDGTNYGKILEHLERFESGEAQDPAEAPGDSGGDSSGDSGSRGSNDDAKRFLIDEIVITGVRAEIDLLPELGDAAQTIVEVPEVRLTGLDSSSFTAAELLDLIVKALLGAVAEGGTGILPEGTLADLQGRLAKLKDVPAEVIGEVREHVEAVEGELDQLEDEAKGVVDEALDGLKDGKSLEDIKDEAQGDTKDSLKEAGKKLEGLFGGSKEKDDGR